MIKVWKFFGILPNTAIPIEKGYKVLFPLLNHHKEENQIFFTNAHSKQESCKKKWNRTNSNRYF